MARCEVSEKIDELITTALEAHDDRLAVAERQFCQEMGLDGFDEATAWALGDLTMVVGNAYLQAAFSAFWAGYSAGANGK